MKRSKFMRKPGSAQALFLLGLAAWCASLILPPTEVAAARPQAPFLIPDSTAVYFRIANVPELRERFSQTSMGQILADEGMKPLVGEIYNLVNAEVERIKEQIGVSLPELLQIPQGEACFALVAPENGRVSFVLMIEVADQAPTAKKILTNIRDRQNGVGEPVVEMIGDIQLRIFANPNANPNQDEAPIQAEAEVQKKGRRTGPRLGIRGRGPAEFCYFEHQGLIGLTDSREIARSMLANWNGEQRPSLSGNATFTSIMNRCSSDRDGAPQITFFADPITLAKRASQGNFQATTVLSILSSLGINGIKGLGGSLTFSPEDFDSIGHFHLSLDNPRTGILELLAIRDGDTTPETWVPSDIESYMTAYWDVSQTFGALAKIVDTFSGPGTLSNQLKQNLSDRIGVDIENEVLPALDGQLSLISWIERPVTLNSQATLVAAKLKDAEKFRPLVDRVVERFSENVESRGYRGMKMHVSREVLPNPGENAEGFRQRQPCGLVLGDYLLATDSPKLLQHVIDTHLDASGSLVDELDFKLIASKIRRQTGGGNPGLIMFNRPEEGMRAMYDLATSELGRQRLAQMGQGNRFVGGVDQALRANPLPPFATIAKYLAPSGGLVTSDDTGLHYMTFSLRRQK